MSGPDDDINGSWRPSSSAGAEEDHWDEETPLHDSADAAQNEGLQEAGPEDDEVETVGDEEIADGLSGAEIKVRCVRDAFDALGHCQNHVRIVVGVLLNSPVPRKEDVQEC